MNPGISRVSYLQLCQSERRSVELKKARNRCWFGAVLIFPAQSHAGVILFLLFSMKFRHTWNGQAWEVSWNASSAGQGQILLSLRRTLFFPCRQIWFIFHLLPCYPSFCTSNKAAVIAVLLTFATGVSGEWGRETFICVSFCRLSSKSFLSFWHWVRLTRKNTAVTVMGPFDPFWGRNSPIVSEWFNLVWHA